MRDGAPSKPRTKWQSRYQRIGGKLCIWIARNHPFVDGSKRTAAVVSETFLVLNGSLLRATDAELVVAFVALAAGELSEEELIVWFRDHLG